MALRNDGPAPSQLTGQAGVWAVASQLALQGLHPHFPGVDYGYDLLIDGGLRLQVKAARQRTEGKAHAGLYCFKFWQSNILSGSQTVRKRGARDYSQVCDFVILWGIDEDRFWVVPAALIAQTQSVQVGPQGFYKRQAFEAAKSLAAAGLSQPEIAERLGISQPGVSYQLRGGRAQQPKRTVTAQVRDLENRWDLITGALATLREAHDVLESAPTVDSAVVTKP